LSDVKVIRRELHATSSGSIFIKLLLLRFSNLRSMSHTGIFEDVALLVSERKDLAVLLYNLPNAVASSLLWVMHDVLIYFAFLVAALNYLRLSSFLILTTVTFGFPSLFFALSFAAELDILPCFYHMLFTMLFMACFMQTYPVFEGQKINPSVLILLAIETKGSVSREEMIGLISNETSASGEIKLLNDKFVTKIGSTLKLSMFGNILALVFIFYKSLMRDKQAGG
jgi:hypothetical protein